MVLNTLARGIMGQSTLSQGISLMNLLDEETIKKLLTQLGQKFGQYSRISARLAQDLWSNDYHKRY